MRTVDFDELTKKLNEFRMNSLDKTFVPSELKKVLREIGFSTAISSLIMQKCFPYQKLGKNRLYEASKDPIHRGIIVKIYNDYNNRRRKSVNSDITDAWDTLVEAGMIKSKFNLTKLKTEYPEIYLKCLDYEIIK